MNKRLLGNTEIAISEVAFGGVEIEQIMGKAFKDRRSEVVIASKCVHLLDKNGKLPPKDKLKESFIKRITK